MMYNLISSIQARRNVFRNFIDAESGNSDNGIAHITHKKTKTVMVLGPEILDGLYMALVRVNDPEN